jgi:hypothetical protein
LTYSLTAIQDSCVVVMILIAPRGGLANTKTTRGLVSCCFHDICDILVDVTETLLRRPSAQVVHSLVHQSELGLNREASVYDRLKLSRISKA